MRASVPLTAVATAALLLATLTGAAAPTAAAADRDPGPGGSPLVKVSHGDPYADCTIGATSPDSVVYPGSEVEPYLAVDPRDPKRVVTVFQQDRWNDGGARGLVASWTTDGRTFHRSTLPFSLCAPGGADFERATDPWVSTGPDGTVYASGEGVDFVKSTRTGLLAATSHDGGRTWQNPTTTHVDAQPFFNDKPSLTADPVRAGTAYQVWNRLDNAPPGPGSLDGPGYLSLTRDGGRTWSRARKFVDTAAVPNTQTIGHLIVVDRRTGTLYDFFDRITYSGDLSTVVEARYQVVTSTDAGETWSAPVTVARDTSVPEVDPNDPAKPLRAASTLPSPAVDPGTGTLYMAYEGADFTAGRFNSIQLVRSTDGGRTWGAPELISPGNVPAFSPSIAVDERGTVALTYYDLRFLEPGDTTTLPTAYQLATLPHGDARRRTERRISRVFDWLEAPFAGGYFLGDYQGLVADGKGVRAVLTLTRPDAPRNRTDVYTATFPTG
ncbi:exo-alpha-sialidase [Streptomyces sp. WAC07061]|uniref:sialidase family protein n=1 Tax=Streptomyces sp. WAC07061 TaxID=2487410 RepID=UPI000F770FF0|nr:sialidase family protein [Streptomyces sp. WAC07061]RSS43752.1 exo-alpha-sialidase [Streptomyces sp. WAC07061]